MVRVAYFRADELGAPTRIANRLPDIILRDLGICSTWSPRRIGINIRRTYMRFVYFIEVRRFFRCAWELCPNEPCDKNNYDRDEKKRNNTFSASHPLPCHLRPRILS